MHRFSIKTGTFLVIMTGLFSTGPLLAQDAASTYKAKCAMCHGADGKGTPTGQKMGVHDFTSPEVQKMSDDDLASAISTGKNKMPAYGKSLNAGQVKDLVSYIRILEKK
jgi:cytochrome c6